MTLLEEQMKTYDEDIIKNSREHYKRLKDLNDIIAMKIDEFKDTMFDILKSRKEKVKQTFILPVNDCLPNYFKNLGLRIIVVDFLYILLEIYLNIVY